MVSRDDISHGIEAYPIAYDEFKEEEKGRHAFSFEYVKTNVPGPGCDKQMFTEQYAGCSCHGTCSQEHCSCLHCFGSAYDLNGMIKDDVFTESSLRPVLECGNDCRCDRDLCTNRVVQKGIQDKLQVFQTQEKGFGLRLKSNADSGVTRLSFVCEYAGEVVGEKEARRRINQTEYSGEDNYLIAIREHVDCTELCTYVDPRYVGNVGRFINHSCDPNLIMVPVRVNHQIPRLALFARKSIKPGEELTFDYSGNTTLGTSSNSNLCLERKVSSQECVGHFGENVFIDSSLNSDRKFKSDLDEDSSVQNLNENETDYESPCKRTKQSSTPENDQTAPNPSVNCKDREPSASNGDSHKKSALNMPGDIDTAMSARKQHGEISMIHMNLNHDDVVSAAPEVVKRKPCHCGSSNCTGFLPFDNKLLCD